MRRISDRDRYSLLVSTLDYCCVCGARRTDLHEVFPGPHRQASKDYGMVIPLCRTCHERIHKDRLMRHECQSWAQKKFEDIYGHDKFMEIFKKNYL